jgi:hypothetical protein
LQAEPKALQDEEAGGATNPDISIPENTYLKNGGGQKPTRYS